MIKKLGLGSRVAFTFFCLTAFVIAVNIYLNYRTSQDYFRDEIIGNLYTLAVAKKNHLYELFRSIKFETEEEAKNPLLQKNITQLIELKTASNGLLKDIQNNLNSFELVNQNNFLGTNILSPDGSVIASSDLNEIGKNEKKEEFFSDFLKMKNTSSYVKDDYSSYHFGDVERMITVISPIINDKGKTIAFLSNYYKDSILNSVIFNLSTTNDYGKNVNIYLVDASKVLIARSGFVNNSSLGQIVGTLPTLNCFSNQETAGRYEDYQNKEVDGAGVCINNGWTLIVESDEQAALRGFENIRVNIVKATLVIFIVLLLTLLYVRHFVEKLLDDFLSIAAHELRTPLGGMKWRIELLMKKNAAGAPELMKDLTHLFDSNRRSIEIVNDLLGVSKIQRRTLFSEPKKVDLKPLLAEVIKELTQESELKEIVITNNAPESLQIMVDEKQFSQVMENLLSNAVKYGKAHGRVEITTEKINQKFVRIIIKDNGIGIGAKDQKKIFSKFFRAENAVFLAGEGTGLGLYVAKTFIEKAGGKIWFTSVEGEGTTFYVEVPCF
jgi:signal transduction histidine kinase